MVARTAGIGASSPFVTGLVKVGNPPMAAIPVEPAFDRVAVRRLLLEAGSQRTLCWREMDSNFRFRCVRRS
jgi:hypothetical protein